MATGNSSWARICKLRSVRAFAGSNSSTRSDELFREFEFGKSRNILLVTKIESIDQTELNPFFRIRQAIDITKPTAGSQNAMQARLEVLVDRLREYLMTEDRLNEPSGMAFSLLDSASQRGRGRQASGVDIIYHSPPRLLPYLTNRYEQQRYLTKELQAELDRQDNRPITFVAVGAADDCLDSFVEQVRYVRLPAILESNGLAPDVLYRRLQWPTPDMQTVLPSDSVECLFDDVRSQVYDTLAVKVTADKSVIERKLANTSGSCLFHIGVSLADWSGPQRELMLLWLRWFARLDLARVRHPIITVISIEYPSGFLYRLWCQRMLNTLRYDIRAIASEAEFGASVHALPELHSVRFDDVEQWIREYVENVDREVLRRRIRKHFLRTLGLRERRLSMYVTAEIVKAALSDPAVRIGVS